MEESVALGSIRDRLNLACRPAAVRRQGCEKVRRQGCEKCADPVAKRCTLAVLKRGA